MLMYEVRGRKKNVVREIAAPPNLLQICMVWLRYDNGVKVELLMTVAFIRCCRLRYAVSLTS